MTPDEAVVLFGFASEVVVVGALMLGYVTEREKFLGWRALEGAFAAVAILAVLAAYWSALERLTETDARESAHRRRIRKDTLLLFLPLLLLGLSDGAFHGTFADRASRVVCLLVVLVGGLEHSGWTFTTEPHEFTASPSPERATTVRRALTTTGVIYIAVGVAAGAILAVEGWQFLGARRRFVEEHDHAPKMHNQSMFRGSKTPPREPAKKR